MNGNHYWHEELSRCAGEKVRVRFDPERLHADIEVYDATDRFICTAQVERAVGFRSQQGAKDLAKAKIDFRKKTKAASDSLDLLTAREVAAQYGELETADLNPPEPSVVRPVRARGSAAVRAISEPAQTALRNTAIATNRLAAAAARLRIVD